MLPYRTKMAINGAGFSPLSGWYKMRSAICHMVTLIGLVGRAAEIKDNED
jgi:hypothetical protein